MESQNLPIDEDVRTLGNKAAYSKDEISDDDRRYMLNRLVEIKKEKKADEKRKKKLAGHHMPVSYTHLDVYKRQAQRMAVLCERSISSVWMFSVYVGGQEQGALGCLLYTSRCV